MIRSLFEKARDAWQRLHGGPRVAAPGCSLARHGRKVIFRKNQKNVSAGIFVRLICWLRASFAGDPAFFLTLAFRTARLRTHAKPRASARWTIPACPLNRVAVGTAISGIEMKISENEEIVCVARTFFRILEQAGRDGARVADGWFHTGDQGEVNVRGNWRISGRIKT